MNLTTIFTKAIYEKRIDKLEEIPLSIIDEYEKEIISLLINHHRTYGEFPSIEALKKMGISHFYDTSVPLMNDNIDYVFDKYIERARSTKLGSVIEQERLDAETQHRPIDFNEILGEIQQITRCSTRLGTNSSVDIFEPEIINLFTSEHSTCMELGLPKIDKDITISPGTLNVIVARLKVGKTMLLCDIAIKLAKQGKKVLFFSREMSNIEILKRLYSMLIGVNSRRFNTTNKQELETLLAAGKSALEQIRKAGGNILLPLEGLDTIDKVIHAVDFYNPDVLLGDSIYQMTTANGSAAQDWRAFLQLIIDFKSLCTGDNRSENLGMKGKKLIVFVTTQLRRSDGQKDAEIDPSDIAYSDGIAQNADLVLGLRPTNNNDGTRVVEIVANRHGAMGTWEQLQFDFDNGKIIIVDKKPKIIKVGNAKNNSEEEDD